MRLDVFIPEYTYNYMSMYTKVYVQLYVFKSYEWVFILM